MLREQECRCAYSDKTDRRQAQRPRVDPGKTSRRRVARDLIASLRSGHSRSFGCAGHHMSLQAQCLCSSGPGLGALGWGDLAFAPCCCIVLQQGQQQPSVCLAISIMGGRFVPAHPSSNYGEARDWRHRRSYPPRNPGPGSSLADHSPGRTGARLQSRALRLIAHCSNSDCRRRVASRSSLWCSRRSFPAWPSLRDG